MAEPGENLPYGHRGTEGEHPESPSFRERIRKVNWRMVLGVLAAVALLVFIAQNTDDVEVNFLGWDWNLPLFLLLLITIILTVVCAQIAGWYWSRRRRKR